MTIKVKIRWMENEINLKVVDPGACAIEIRCSAQEWTFFSFQSHEESKTLILIRAVSAHPQKFTRQVWFWNHCWKVTDSCNASWMSFLLLVSMRGAHALLSSLRLFGQHPLVAPFAPAISTWVLKERLYLISKRAPTHFLSLVVQRSAPVSFNSALIIWDREIIALVQMSRHHYPLPNFILLLQSQQPQPGFH